MVYISQSVCVIFDFFQQCLIVFCIQVFCLFGWFIPRYFILFVAVVNTIVSLTSLSDFSLLVYRNADVWYIKCCPCYKTFAYFFICCYCLVTMMFNSLQLHARLPCPSVSQSLLKLMSIESVILSNYLILCRSLLLLPSIFPKFRICPNELLLASDDKSIGASAPVLPMNIRG